MAEGDGVWEDAADEGGARRVVHEQVEALRRPSRAVVARVHGEVRERRARCLAADLAACDVRARVRVRVRAGVRVRMNLAARELWGQWVWWS